MKSKYIYDRYLNNPEGGTFWLGHESFKTGYVLALPNNELRIDLDCVGQSLFEFYQHACLDLNADGLGWWFNADENKLYIDSVIHVDTLDEAVTLGKEYNQLAVYCLDTNEVIDL
jgi:hypothetical protein